MPNEGTFALDLLGVEQQTITDPDVDISFHRGSDNKIVSQSLNLAFPPKKKFKLPAFPQAQNLYADIAPSRYRLRKSGFFTLTNGETIARNLTVLRDPKQWQASFTPWQQLPKSFKSLREVLQRSPNINVKEKKSLIFPLFTSEAYDGVTDEKALLAKTALLNLYAKTTLLIEPVHNQQPWFSFVIRILQIGRERFIAQVDPQMGTIVRTIKDNLNQYKMYKHTNAQNHYENVAGAAPADFKVLKSKMFSIKSDEETGNIQLTLAPARDAEGDEILLLDVDIDENGTLMKHLCDMFKHIFLGGTHPYDIHEYLRLAHSTADLGYRLMPRRS
ncbi:MAG: hypothetical protein JST84_22765 [Acidobacteria bacterium]|nr:hypothetical protein [Acidobacteriota bacterium]